MKECNNSKIHISSNFLLSICLLVMLDTLLLVPSLHCNTSQHFTTLHHTLPKYTSLLDYVRFISIIIYNTNKMSYLEITYTYLAIDKDFPLMFIFTILQYPFIKSILACEMQKVLSIYQSLMAITLSIYRSRI